MSKSESTYDANDLKKLEGLEGIRKRPDMYIGGRDVNGLHHLVFEIVANSVDEALAGRCDTITVEFNKDGSCEVTDDGHGIPVGMNKQTKKPGVEMVMMDLHAGGKFEGKAYNTAGGLHGIGLKAVNACSDWTRVTVWQGGKEHLITFARGKKTKDLHTVADADKTGTRVAFLPDPTIFETLDFKYGPVAVRLRELAFLAKGITINLIDHREDGQSEVFHFKDGIKEFVAWHNRNKTRLNEDVVYVHKTVNPDTDEEVEVEAAFQWCDSEGELATHTYANYINNPFGGTHMTGFRKGLTRGMGRYMTRYLEKKGKIKNKKAPSVSGEDYREGLYAVISVKVKNPQFEGQTKVRLLNREVEVAVDQAVSAGLEMYLEEHPKSAEKICDSALIAARAREAARKAREVVRKGALQTGFMASKLADCISKNPDHAELYVVEGDSAGGSAKQGRERMYQAILPLRGKILNVEKATLAKMLQHTEIQNLIASVGTGIGTEEPSKGGFDISKLRYKKLIIMTDADVDGSHIRTLLLTFLFRQLPQLIESGNIYVAQPPLYKVTPKGKKKGEYVRSDAEMNDTLMNIGLNSVTIAIPSDMDIDAAGREFSGSQFRSEVFERLIRLEQLRGRVARRGVNPVRYFAQYNAETKTMPSSIVFSADRAQYFHDHEESELNKFIAERYNAGFEVLATAEIHNRETQIDGVFDPKTVEERIEMPEVAGDVAEVITELAVRGFPAWTINGREDQAHQFELRFDDSDSIFVDSLNALLSKVREFGGTGISLQRYKGLGEMNADELWETTMDPANRVLLQVTMDDADAADEMFTILMGDQVEPRRAFIERHALEVKNLDV
ncbi:MAG: DNA gyrase subunit B [Planctomycetota bacterium]